MQDRSISFEVAVILICLSSCLLLRVSDTTILVPSDLTTRSSGEMRNAKGNLPTCVSVSACSRYLKQGGFFLRQTLDDDKSDISVGSDTSFDTLDVILCQAVGMSVRII